MSCALMNEAAAFSEDAFLGGRLRLRQPISGHRAGHDAILLAAATAVHPDDRVVDLGAGVGAAGLAVAARVGGLALTLVEIDPDLAALARHNAAANAIPADVIVCDVTGEASALAGAGLAPDSFDVVLMNPPFHDAGRHRASPDPARSLAHMSEPATLDAWIHAARRMLKSGGALTLIWRADGVGEVLAALSRGFGSLVLLPVHGDVGKPAIRILVRAIKGGRAPLQILAGIALNPSPGQPNAVIEAAMAGQGTLPLAPMNRKANA